MGGLDHFVQHQRRHFFTDIDMSLVHKALPEGFRGRCGYTLEGPYTEMF